MYAGVALELQVNFGGVIGMEEMSPAVVAARQEALTLAHQEEKISTLTEKVISQKSYESEIKN